MYITNHLIIVRVNNLSSDAGNLFTAGDTGSTSISQFRQNKIDTDIATLQKWKEQLHISLVSRLTQYCKHEIISHVIQHDVSHDPQQGGLLDLPSVILDHVISYLTDPHDLLNFGLTHPLVIYVLNINFPVFL